ncbi:hypothetical protein KR222_003951, partial [Zaprionus bogoriensis]
MVLLRSFRRGNRYISYHALLLLRFYLAQFYYLGLLRLRYERVANAVHLTHYSLTISRMLGLLFAFLLCLALLSSSSTVLYLQPYLYVCFLLWQSRRQQERRVRLINEFLRLAPVLYRLSRRQLKLSWLLVLQLALKLLTLKLYLALLLVTKDGAWKLGFLFIYVLPASLAVWCLDMSSNLVNIGLSLLHKSFEQLNTELGTCAEQLHMKVLHGDYQAVRRIQRRLRARQRLFVAYSRLTQQLLDCLAPQLLLIVIYNLTLIYALSYAHWRRLLDIALLGNGLRLLFHSLDALVVATATPRDTSWLQVARQLQFSELLERHGWFHRHGWTALDIDSCGQSVRRALLQPRLQMLGLFSPNRRFFCRLLVSYCSYLYLHYMWTKRLPVAERQIF